MSDHRRAYRRVTKALRLAQSGEADSIVAAAKEILATRIKHGNALGSPAAVRDYLRLLLNDREHEVFAAVFLDAQHRVLAAEELFRGTLTQTSVYRFSARTTRTLRVKGLVIVPSSFSIWISAGGCRELRADYSNAFLDAQRCAN